VREYELMIVLDPNLDEATVATAKNRVESVISQRGVIKSVDDWGRRRLAYPIGRHRDGTYVLVRFQAKAEAAQDVERALKLMESVVRHLVVRVDQVEPATAQA
jgi:small subunit ribosomal protein S6